jgi:murein DD-endopeptidase MepM/ murein hydrolase activator NlpD
MDSETNQVDGARRDISQGFRPKPFLTILDGKPAGAGRASRSPSRIPASGKSLIRKSGTRLQSYAGEGVRTVVAACKAGVETTSKTLAGIPRSVFKAISRQRPSSQAHQHETVAEIEKKPGSESKKTDRRISIHGISLKNTVAKLKALRLGSIRMPSPRTRKIILFAFIGAIAISAGAAAIIGAANFPATPASLVLPDEDSAQSALMAYIEPDAVEPEELSPGALPPIPVSIKISSYTIKSGDTLEKVAKRFGLRQDTIISANNLQSASSIRSGVQLRIPNMDGISHRVRKGESLSSLARAYAIDMTRIVDANDLASSTISAGQNLFIPNARLSSASLREFYGERFVWPARGRISSPFGYRANPFTGLRTYHSAIDIVVSVGTKVKATSDGSVADTGYNSVFGNYIILKHASGYQSLYAHLSSIGVKEGASVAQNAVIGLSGNTGQSTGPHLHFSIFKNGQALDPAKYVK